MTVETGFSGNDLRGIADIIDVITESELIIERVTIRTTDGDKIVLQGEGDGLFVVSHFDIKTEVPQ